MYNNRKGGVDVDNKNIFAVNLKRYVALNDKSRKDISNALGISYYTVTDWVNGKKYPRMDKVEMLANYFGILKSDLIETKTDEHIQMHKKNDILSDAIIKMRTDEDFMSVVESLMSLDSEGLAVIKQMASALKK